jgi:signal recognition particle subunit SRP54
MGDVLTLMEKAEKIARQSDLKKQELSKASDFNLDHLLEQLRQLKKMGSMDEIISMMPGDAGVKKQMAASAPDEGRIKRMEAILLSMTARERRFPQLLDGSRRRRVSKGSGTRPDEVNALLRQYDLMRKMMKKGSLLQKAQNLMGGMGGFPSGRPPGFER